MKRVHVAVGVVVDDRQNILLTRRPDHVHQGGLWEFPGGKVEEGEDLASALARELREELDIEPLETSSLIEIQHDYDDKSVLLDVHMVWQFSGRPKGLEGQPMAWVAVADLADYAFPLANEPIIPALMAALK